MEWVKVMCNFLDHRKIRLIRKGSKGDSLVLLWLLLITEAGKCGRGGALLISENNPYTAETLSLLLITEAGKCGRGGALLISENNPYTIETLSLLLDMPKPMVEQGLELFTRLEMIEREEDILWIRNWRKYQSEDKLEFRREKERLRQQRGTEKKFPRCHHRCHVKVTLENRQEQSREEQKRKEQTSELFAK